MKKLDDFLPPLPVLVRFVHALPGGQLTCHWSEVTEGHRPLRWSSDGCRSVKKLYLE